MSIHVRVGEMADMLHERSNSWKIMLLMRAYFDESWIGKRQQRITALAGFLAPATLWDQFEDDWREAWRPYRDKYGIETFHMTDCLGGHGGFVNIEKFYRYAIITSLSLVVGRYKLRPIWSAVLDNDWDAVVKDAAFLARYPKPLDLCFDHVVQQMLNLRAVDGFSGGVAAMFAEQEEYNPRMMEVYSAYRKHPEWAKFLRPIAFGSPTQVVPLQAADMAAYGTARDRSDVEYPTSEVTLANPRNFLNNMLKYRGPTESGCFDSMALRNVIKKFKP